MRPLIGLPRLVTLGALAVAVAGCVAAPRVTDHASSGMPAPGFPQVQRHLAEREYWASENDRGLQAPNRAHRLRTYFDPGGIRVVDREDPASPELLGLRFEAWGREGSLAQAGEATSATRTSGSRSAGPGSWSGS